MKVSLLLQMERALFPGRSMPEACHSRCGIAGKLHGLCFRPFPVIPPIENEE